MKILLIQHFATGEGTTVIIRTNSDEKELVKGIDDYFLKDAIICDIDDLEDISLELEVLQADVIKFIDKHLPILSEKIFNNSKHIPIINYKYHYNIS